MTHDEDRFNEYLQRLAHDANPAPDVPREEIWARIDAARRPHRTTSSGDVIDLASRRPLAQRVHLTRWAAALAAMLVLGVAIGRMTLGSNGGTAPAPVANAPVDSAALLPYQLAAAQHLARTEALLTALPTDVATGQSDEVSTWAGELLTDTRLLLDSPAGEDAALKRLLEDLELVLAQIAALPQDKPEGEVELIQDGMNQRDVLLRLRAATAGSEVRARPTGS